MAEPNTPETSQMRFHPELRYNMRMAMPAALTEANIDEVASF
jgi:hypothetical protein